MAQIKVQVDDWSANLEDALSILNGKIKVLERTITDLEEANEHLSDGLESAKKQIKLLEEVEIKKTTSLFQTLIEALHLKPKSRIKETVVNLDERNQV